MENSLNILIFATLSDLEIALQVEKIYPRKSAVGILKINVKMIEVDLI